MPEDSPTPSRLEAFSDGVIAVIITVMVLEIKVPRIDGLAGLRDLLPSLLIYALSFAFTGIYWLNHQHLVRRTEKAGHAMQCSNLIFLFCLSLLPLATAYVVEKELSGFAVAVYSALLLVVALAFMLFRLAVHGHISRADELSADDRAGFRNHVLSMVVYAAGIGVAFAFPKTVLVCLAGLTLLWTLPNLSLGQARKNCN